MGRDARAVGPRHYRGFCHGIPYCGRDGFSALAATERDFRQGWTQSGRKTLTVFAPADFRVLAPGKPLKRVVTGTLVTQGFRNPGQDFLPYVVAGRYQEQVDTRP